MKSLFFKLLVLISLVTFSCNSNRQDNESEEGAIILTIEGIEVLIREYPTDGDVIFKLNTGDECKVIKKGKEETIDGVTDFWYKIEYDGQSGWVFGAQSNLKQITEKYKIEFELIGNDKSLSFNTIKEISGEHYNEIPQEYIDETTNEKPKVELISKKFFVEKDVVKAFVFLGFRNLNLCHGCIGRTDAILYKKFDNEWIELDFFEDNRSECRWKWRIW